MAAAKPNLIAAVAVGLKNAAMLLEQMTLSLAHEAAPHGGPFSTGAFAAGLVSDVAISDAEVVITIASTVDKPKPEWVEEGTKPHMIPAEDTYFLDNPSASSHSPDPGGFSAMGPVMHPGTQPNEWADTVLGEVAAVAEDTITAAIQEALAAQ
jgi:hypothetical protein